MRTRCCNSATKQTVTSAAPTTDHRRLILLNAIVCPYINNKDTDTQKLKGFLFNSRKEEITACCNRSVSKQTAFLQSNLFVNYNIKML